MVDFFSDIMFPLQLIYRHDDCHQAYLAVVWKAIQLSMNLCVTYGPDILDRQELSNYFRAPMYCAIIDHLLRCLLAKKGAYYSSEAIQRIVRIGA